MVGRRHRSRRAVAAARRPRRARSTPSTPRSLRLLDHLVAFGEVPPFRAALLPPPVDRNETYSASARYARALAGEWLPRDSRGRRPTGRRCCSGASLGALAALHATGRPGPASAGSSSSRAASSGRRFDAQEAALPRFARITRFVGAVLGGARVRAAIPMTITCGTAEENLDNNRVARGRAHARGWDARARRAPDAHNWISWRDSFAPAPRRAAAAGAGREARRRARDRRDCSRTATGAGRCSSSRRSRAAAGTGRTGMIGALAGLIDDGRVKVYCVDACGRVARGAPTTLPLEERARRHGDYEDWILDARRAVDPRRLRGGGRSSSPALSFGAYHAANFALQARRPLPARDLHERRLRRRRRRLGRARRRRLLQQPARLRVAPARRPPRLALLARARSLLVVGQGAVGGHDRRARLDPPVRVAARARRGSARARRLGRGRRRTTGPHGDGRSLTICPALSEH